MSADRIIRPAFHEAACINCTAWWAWDSVAVGRETAAGFVVIGRRPNGQCRAAPPNIDPDAIGGETATWLVVAADSWCRSFERTPASETGEAA